MNVWLALQHILLVSILALVLWILVIGALDLYHDWQEDREWTTHLTLWTDEVCMCSHNKSSHHPMCWDNAKGRVCPCESYAEYRP